MFLAYNTRAYPANKQMLLDLCRLGRRLLLLGFRSWADLATADQMMGSAANMRDFLRKLEEASRAGAEREFEEVMDFVRRSAAGSEGDRYREPRLLVRAVPAGGI